LKLSPGAPFDNRANGRGDFLEVKLQIKTRARRNANGRRGGSVNPLVSPLDAPNSERFASGFNGAENLSASVRRGGVIVVAGGFSESENVFGNRDDAMNAGVLANGTR
jgi:hypothetical protein